MEDDVDEGGGEVDVEAESAGAGDGLHVGECGVDAGDGAGDEGVVVFGGFGVVDAGLGGACAGVGVGLHGADCGGECWAVLLGFAVC